MQENNLKPSLLGILVGVIVAGLLMYISIQIFHRPKVFHLYTGELGYEVDVRDDVSERHLAAFNDTASLVEGYG